MKLRLWILIALAALALLASSTPVFRDTHHGQTAAKVFDTILEQAYPGWTGFRMCVPGDAPQHDLCWAELHHGNRYVLSQLDIDMSQANPVPGEVSHHEPWTRGPMHIASPYGHGTANTREYGWEYLMQNVPAKKLPTTFFDAQGGPASFPPQMFRFRCTGVPMRVTCANALGDSITYTPTVL